MKARLILFSVLALAFSMQAETRYAVQALHVSVGEGHASALNKKGQIVGSYFDLEAASHDLLSHNAFIYSGGKASEIPPDPKLDSFPVGVGDINDAGDMVGNTISYPFLYRDGAFVNLATATNGALSAAIDINNQGQVVGYVSEARYRPVTAIYANGRVTKLPTVKGFWGSQPAAINDAGQVAGTLGLGANHYHAFLFKNGRMIDIGEVGKFRNSEALDINAKGWVIGTLYQVKYVGPTHGFLFRDGVLSDLESLVGADGESVAEGINKQGAVVGWSSFPPFEDDYGDKVIHGFILENGSMRDLNDFISPDYGLTIHRGMAINDRGVITAAGGKKTWSSEVYLLRPLDPGAAEPRLRMESNRIVVHSRHAMITGKSIGAVSVTYRSVTNPRIVDFAHGAKDWSFRLSLRKNRPVVFMVTAHGVGGDSEPVKVTVIRR